MRRLTQVALVGVVILAVASVAAAQQALQPVYRLGNFIEVGNDVFMHIIATSNIYYTTSQNRDFEGRVRDRTNSRFRSCARCAPRARSPLPVKALMPG